MELWVSSDQMMKQNSRNKQFLKKSQYLPTGSTYRIVPFSLCSLSSFKIKYTGPFLSYDIESSFLVKILIGYWSQLSYGMDIDFKGFNESRY